MRNYFLTFLKERLRLSPRLIFSSIMTLSMAALLKFYSNGPAAVKTRVENKVVIITGASDGIGVTTAKELLEGGAIVIFACRNEKKTLELISSFETKLQKRCFYILLDLSSFKSVNNFIKEFKSQFNRLDILINNAGSVFNSFGTTEDGIERTLQINTFSHMILTQGLLDLLHKSNGRVVNLASRAHMKVLCNESDIKNWNSEDFNLRKDKNDYKYYYQYAVSKLGNVYFNQFLHNYLSEKKLNVKTVALHPGVIHTEISKDVKFKYILMLIYPIYILITKSVWYGSQTTLHCCYLPDNELKSGAYYKDCAVHPVATFAEYSNTELRVLFIDWMRKVINEKGKSSNTEFLISL